MAQFVRFTLSVCALLALIACDSTTLDAGAERSESGRLTRFATAPLGSEVTGIVVAPNGDFFFNIQHPSDSNDPPFDQATIGVVTGLDMNALPHDFTRVPLPADRAAQMRVETAVGGYHIIARQGDILPGFPLGLGGMLDQAGETVLTDSDKPDFNAFVPGSSADQAYLFTNWESLPGGMSRLSITRGESGAWTVSDGLAVDFSEVGGTFSNCFGTLSPWGTPLTSEEFFMRETATWIDPRNAEGVEMNTFSRHIGRFPNPYRYGYIVEIAEPTSDAPRPVKHFAMGRYSHENAVVMPDRRTVYLSDDDNFAGFFKFVADEPEDLSRGTLYAAKVVQDRDDAGNPIADSHLAGFDVTWVELAHGDAATIEGWVAGYDQVGPEDWEEGVNQYITEEEIAAWSRGEAEDDRVAFLETRAAAAAKGATTEFRKLEGVVINPEGAADGSVPWLYAAISYVNGSMADGEGDIQLERNDCGVVYRLRLDEAFDTARMEPVVVGGPFDAEAEPHLRCPNENIANPDNLQVLPDGRIIIAEDGLHQNAMIWVYDPPK